MDDEKRKISVINLNELSAAFHASSRMRAAPPMAESTTGSNIPQRRYSQEDRLSASRYMPSHAEPKLSSEKELGPGVADKDFGRRKRQGVEKYVSDNSQLNLQFERRRLSQHRPTSSDLATASVIRQRSSLGFDPSGHTMHPPPSYSTDQSRSRVLLDPLFLMDFFFFKDSFEGFFFGGGSFGLGSFRLRILS